MTKKVITPTSGSAQTIYYETNDNNTVVKFSAGGRTVTSHSKTDSFGRKVFDELQLGTDFVSRQFVYHAGSVTDTHKEKAKVKSSATTQLVSQIILSDGRTISYEYDKEERITKVTDSIDGVTEYTYDALGQLLTETVNNVVVNTMSYDNYGNIVNKNGKIYTYGNASWKDLLTSFDGQSITYDAQVNPLTYLGHTLTWEKGRQLKSFDGNTYTYNANGIRTSKTVNGVKHEYTLDGTKILRETWGTNKLIPLYDNKDSVCGILYNDVPYYFIKNLQDDIIAIVDKDAQTVARYSYDAWGAVTSAVTYTELTNGVNIATINPFRYRGYYYDEEIGLYYLQSRYYNANTGRFVNGDEVERATFNTNSLINNAYCYCCNNPSNETDYAGNIIWSIVKKILVGVLQGIFKQLLIDSVEWFFKVCFINDKEKFKLSDPEDYVSSILTKIVDQFEVSNIVGLASSIIALLTKYSTKIIMGRMDKKAWLNLLLDVLSLVVTMIMQNSIKKIEKKISKLKAEKRAARSKSKINRKNSAIFDLNLKIKYKGIQIKIIVPNAQQLVSSIINIVC